MRLVVHLVGNGDQISNQQTPIVVSGNTFTCRALNSVLNLTNPTTMLNLPKKLNQHWHLLLACFLFANGCISVMYDARIAPEQTEHQFATELPGSFNVPAASAVANLKQVKPVEVPATELVLLSQQKQSQTSPTP